ncbi:MAG: dehypoxanthine futalosine cyclase [Candidatus Melainabacteria bacterium]|nr:dehypoxanthine futalosine cyclase [Candidatus Melainabacteria bacterium]
MLPIRTQTQSNRISTEEALDLFRNASLYELGLRAEAMKQTIHPVGSPITFVIDSNVNYTNICNVDCRFCAFYRHAEDADAYVLPYEVIAQKAQTLIDAGGTQFLLQGGVNPNLPFDYYTNLLRQLRADFPNLTLHAFSTSEISFMSQLTEKPLSWVLQQLIDAGLSSIPGAGAEILHDEVRLRVSPKKINTHGWLEVMEEAHKLGLKTSATMMFGMGEQDWHIIDHLMQIRQLQDKTGGFTAFIPWTFQPSNTQLEKLPLEYHATGLDFLRVVAISRLVLDNIANIQSSYLTQGMKLCQTALQFGANDMGGLVLEENVVTEAGVKHETADVAEAVKIIHQLGVPAAQRDTQYRILKTYTPLAPPIF